MCIVLKLRGDSEPIPHQTFFYYYVFGYQHLRYSGWIQGYYEHTPFWNFLEIEACLFIFYCSHWYRVCKQWRKEVTRILNTREHQLAWASYNYNTTPARSSEHTLGYFGENLEECIQVSEQLCWKRDSNWWPGLIFVSAICVSYEGCSKSLWPDHEGAGYKGHSMHKNTKSQYKNICSKLSSKIFDDT